MPGSVRTTIFLPQDPLSRRIGGILTFVKGFVRFAPADFDIEIVGTTTDPGERPERTWQAIELEGRAVRFLPLIHDRSSHGRPRVPIALRYTSALLRRPGLIGDEPRILQFHRAGVPLAFRRDSRPKIQVVHLNVGDIYAGGGESRWRRLPGAYHRVEDLTLPSMDRIFVVNRAGVEFYRHRHPELDARLGFLPTWVDDDLFTRPSAEQRTAARRRIADLIAVPNVPTGRLLLFVGRLERQKDPVLLVEAFAAAQHDFSDLRLLIVGDGSMRSETERTAHRLGIDDRTHFLGYRPRDEIAGIMRACDALILSSRFEGMPISALEALASGLPVVATPAGELPSIIQTGRNGAISSGHSARALAASISQVVSMDRESLATRAVSAVEPYRARTVLDPFFEAHRRLWP